jgi:hypothetical protein
MEIDRGNILIFDSIGALEISSSMNTWQGESQGREIDVDRPRISLENGDM